MSKQYAKDQPAGFTNRFDNVAIVGANGRVGKHIVAAMVKNNSHKKITAITRTDANSVIPAGVVAAKVDYNNQESLVEALKGHDILVITMSVTAPPETQQKLVDAAVAAGIKWIVPNEYGYGGSSESFRNQQIIGPAAQKMRDYLDSKGINWVAVSCGFWYEFSLPNGEWTFGVDWNKKHVTWIDDGEQKITVSSLPQAGRGAAALLNLPILPQDENDERLTLSNFRNGFGYVGSFTVSQKEMFASVLRVTGSKESEWTFESEPSKPRWDRAFAAFQKTHERTAFAQTMYTRVFFSEDSGDMTNWNGLGKLDNERLGLKEENIDEWTKVAIQTAEAQKQVQA